MTGFKGSCLCGAVAYESKADPMLVWWNCVDCRKSSGTGHCTHIVVPEEGFSVSGEVRFYDRPADSGNIVSRGFCPTCGSAVVSKNSGMQGMVFPRASSLDDLEVIAPKMAVYVSRAASWDSLPPGLASFETSPEGGPKKVIAEASRPTGPQ